MAAQESAASKTAIFPDFIFQPEKEKDSLSGSESLYVKFN
jgi:hypothetical protein